MLLAHEQPLEDVSPVLLLPRMETVSTHGADAVGSVDFVHDGDDGKVGPLPTTASPFGVDAPASVSRSRGRFVARPCVERERDGGAARRLRARAANAATAIGDGESVGGRECDQSTR